MFSGENINTTEDRAVLHAACAQRLAIKRRRAAESDQRVAWSSSSLSRVKLVSEKIRSGHWVGSTGKAITDVINIGIGGSDLGPKLACSALQEFAHPNIKLHFISNVDGAEILSTLKSSTQRQPWWRWPARPLPPRKHCSMPKPHATGLTDTGT